eukprot:6332823-Karenia_brevis.AAC.1
MQEEASTPTFPSASRSEHSGMACKEEHFIRSVQTAGTNSLRTVSSGLCNFGGVAHSPMSKIDEATGVLGATPEPDQ